MTAFDKRIKELTDEAVRESLTEIARVLESRFGDCSAKPIANADWVMVPRVPTEAMILAAVRATNGWRLGEGVSINDSIRAAFRAALSASPAHVAVSDDVREHLPMLPLIFYDSPDQTRRITALAEMIEANVGATRFSIQGAARLAEDLRALANRPATTGGGK